MRRMQTSPQQIGIAVVEHGGRYLVGVRSSEQVLAGAAEFPGGKCEPGETPDACAVRECREETGLAVRSLRLLERVEFSYAHGDVELHFWLCRPDDAASVRDGHGGYRWVSVDELPRLNFPAANRSVVERLQMERLLSGPPITP